MAKDKTIYTEDSIQSLSPREHIRLRSGMYIGSNHDPTQLVVEIFSNALDEHNLGHGNLINVSVDTKTGTCSVEDYGQGFPVNQLRSDGKTVLQAAFDEINTSAKYSDDGVYGGTSLGLNGVGAKASNFLSTFFHVTSGRVEDKQYESIWFKDGVLQKRELGKWDNDTSGTAITFTPDPQFFENPIPDTKALRHLFNDICCMCPNLMIHYWVDGTLYEITHPDGITDLVTALVDKDVELPATRLIIQESQDKYRLSCGLTYTSRNSSNIVGYVNYGLTEQGPHITSLKGSITKVMNKWAREQGLIKEKEANLGGDSLQEGLVLVFNLIAPGIAYDSQTKGKIVSKDYVPWLNEIFSNALEIWLDNNPQDGKVIIEKALLARRATEAAKKAREAVRQKAEKKDKVLKMPSKLADCHTKDRSKAELYCTEGDSASGGAKIIRDATYQAVMGLKGKVLNTLTASVDQIIKNAEIIDLLNALGLDWGKVDKQLIVDYNESKLRYGKIIIAADRDPDGDHICLLLLTFFLTYCPALIQNGHVYVALAPLYKAEWGKDNYQYIDNKEELKKFQKTHKKSFTLTYFKGLGEASPQELGKMIMNPKTRNIQQVSIDNIETVKKTFEALMGKDAGPKKEFVFSHRMIEEEDITNVA